MNNCWAKLSVFFGTLLGVINFGIGDKKVDLVGKWVKSLPEEVSVSLAIRDADSEDIIYTYKGKKNVLPASTQKWITTWAALKNLGGDKTFNTVLKYTGKIEADTLMGNIVIKGGGDPSFGSDIFGVKFGWKKISKNWTDLLKKKGIKHVKGCVIADEGILESSLSITSYLWEDIGNYYGAVTSGLCFRDNIYPLTFEGDSVVGNKTSISEIPKFTGIKKFKNGVITGPKGSGDKAYIIGSPLSKLRYIIGTYQAGTKKFTIKGSLPHPGWTCARQFQNYLTLNKITFDVNNNSECKNYIDKPELKFKASEGDTISIHTSTSLINILKEIHTSSNNMYADQLTAMLSVAKNNKGGMEQGLQIISQELERLGISKSEFKIKDGSGLSRTNLISPLNFTKFLSRISREKEFDKFRKTLTEFPSQKGNEFGGYLAKRVYYKTGSMNGIFAVTGYIRTKKNKHLAFFIHTSGFVNRPPNLKNEIYNLLYEVRNHN